MTALFLEMANRSIAAGYLVLLLILLRLVWKGMPKWAAVLLWGFVAFRLLCPVVLESSLSLIPSAQTIPREIAMSPAPSVQTGVSSMDALVNPVIGAAFAPDPAASANPLQILLPALSQIWLLGMAAMGVYTGISYLRLRRRVAAAWKVQENIYESEAVSSPFILGLFRPRIYLPVGLSQGEWGSVIAHEQAHLRRRDHWWKMLGFALLAFVWFHPLMWAAYVLLCRDIELACDEAVVRTLSPGERAAYSQTLLNLSLPRHQIAACPLAFGEIGIKERVRRVLSYRKPGVRILCLCLVLCAVVALTFLTTPSSRGLEMLHGLEEDRIVSIQCGSYDPQPVGLTFYDSAHRNLGRILPVLTGAKGTPISKPWGAEQSDHVQFITIFLRDSGEDNIIQAKIVDNRYLVVEDHWYEADPAWLATVPENKDYYFWLTELSVGDIRSVEFYAEPGQDIKQLEIAQLVACLNDMHIPAIGYPDILPPLRAVYRITTTDGTVRELSILGTEYLLVEDVLYDYSLETQEDTGSSREEERLDALMNYSFDIFPQG